MKLFCQQKQNSPNLATNNLSANKRHSLDFESKFELNVQSKLHCSRHQQQYLQGQVDSSKDINDDG